jgi:hypothetical protein
MLNERNWAPIPLIIDEVDIDAATRNAVAAAQAGTRVLGSDSDLQTPERMLLDALPAAIARKVQAIVPPEFKIAELEFCFKVEGKLWGSGLAGEVKATLRPREASSDD